MNPETQTYVSAPYATKWHAHRALGELRKAGFRDDDLSVFREQRGVPVTNPTEPVVGVLAALFLGWSIGAAVGLIAGFVSMLAMADAAGTALFEAAVLGAVLGGAIGATVGVFGYRTPRSRLDLIQPTGRARVGVDVTASRRSRVESILQQTGALEAPSVIVRDSAAPA